MPSLIIAMLIGPLLIVLNMVVPPSPQKTQGMILLLLLQIALVVTALLTFSYYLLYD